jgi:hypothetical protein
MLLNRVIAQQLQAANPNNVRVESKLPLQAVLSSAAHKLRLSRWNSLSLKVDENNSVKRKKMSRDGINSR